MPTSRSIPVWIVHAVFAIVGMSIPAGRLLAAPPSAQASLHAAWRLADRSGRYEYSSEVRQQTAPLPSLANVGRGPSTEHLYVEGA
ncbi:MAG TPA: hypothetical protein VER55_09500, partial [Ardenticatenaceae bacterium]|nr:hypothetical protein [Ardenticatenaceae bacterium]